MSQGKSYRLIVTYSGFEDVTDVKVIRAARKRPSQMGYDPVDARRTIDFTFRSRKAANNTRVRLVRLRNAEGGFSVSRVIDDNF